MAGFESSNTAQFLRDMGTALDDVREKVAATVEAITVASTDGAKEFRKNTLEYERSAEELETQVGDKLDDLIARFAEARNLWDKEIQFALAAVDAGALRLEDFLTLWGDAVVQTQDGGRRVRELLDGIDFNKRRQEIQEFIQALRKGTIDLDEVLERISSTGFVVAQQLVEMVNAFREGRVSLEEIARLIENIKNQFPDSEFGDLADEILRDLQRGEIG